MELILMTNLAFSIVGFFFIFRMWREVKDRRDYYGENFNIPRGRGNRKSDSRRGRRASADSMAVPVPMSDDLEVYEGEEGPVVDEGMNALKNMDEGDVAKIVQLIAASQKEGA